MAWHHRRSGGASAVGAVRIASRCATAVAVSTNYFVSAQAESLSGLTNHTVIAIAQGTGQGGNDFWAAAAVLSDLITNLVSRLAANSMIGIIQGVNKRGHNLWIADAIVSGSSHCSESKR